MCVEVALRESRTPLRFCNRYVGIGAAGDMGEIPPELASGVAGDLTSAFGVLESEQFASLHVTRVSAQIQARRGLQEASIVSARRPAVGAPGSVGDDPPASQQVPVGDRTVVPVADPRPRPPSGGGVACTVRRLPAPSRPTT